ncbi:MAG: pyruvate kinase [Clostridiales bacterium]|nr:pyruvate kinase [Clostridiales bacterium]
MRRTKIVCTLGPATNTVETMRELIESGLDAARVNFSHGTYDSHTVLINNLKEAREALHAPIPLILDTKGPEIRVKTFRDNQVYLKTGASFTLTTRDVEGDETQVSVTYVDLAKDLKEGTRVLLDDGLVELQVKKIQNNTDIICEVVNGGTLSSNKGVNIPDVFVHLPSLTERDVADIKFGIQMGFDYIAASFIRNANDIINIRRVLEENSGQHIHIIAKIENRDGVNNIDEILDVADGIMVARGDLGVEIPPEEVPLVQKMVIKKANLTGKPVITATQMLESMCSNPRPTRAEANDVANAIIDGSDAIMLSGETAKGNYPVPAVQMMARIAETTEASIDYMKRLNTTFSPEYTNITNAISHAACATAAELGTACIATVTKSGFTAEMVSKYRPVCPIVACTYETATWRQLNLVWGCKPVFLESRPTDSDEIYDTLLQAAQESGLASNGDEVVMVMGAPVGFSGATNTLRVEIVGDVLYKGSGIGNKTVTAKAKVLMSLEEAELNFNTGDILVTAMTSNDMLPYIRKASGIIVGPVVRPENCHAEIVGRALDIPVIMCNAKVTDFIKNDALITIDPQKGFIYSGAHE